MNQRKKWNNYWQRWDSIEEQCTFYGRWLRRQRLRILSHLLSGVNKSYTILELGCGSGETLHYLRHLGFKNAVGIDYSVESIRTCEKHGLIQDKDVYLASAADYCDDLKTFDVVIEEGVWEHYPANSLYKILCQTASLTKKHLLACQPNALSHVGSVLSILAPYVSPDMQQLPEYPHPHIVYTSIMQTFGLPLIGTYPTLLREYAWLVYRRER